MTILVVLSAYFPAWTAPKHLSKQGWNRCHCPNPEHADESPSASVSLEFDAVKCQACGFGGKAVTLVKEIEEVTWREAFRITEELAESSNLEVPQRSERKQGRPVFGGARTSSGDDQSVPTRFRRRA